MDNPDLPESNPHSSESNKSRVDRMLHQRLSKIFRERCLGDSSQIKEFLRAPEPSEHDSIIDLLQQQDPVLASKNMWKKLLMKLSLLWIAVLESYHNSAELLVRSGADVNQLYGLQTRCHQLDLNKKSTILHALLELDPSAENERLIRLVTDHGADLQARDSEGRTALHLAVAKDRIELIEMLLNKGADLQPRDSTGRTALYLAVELGRVQMTQMILEKAAADNVNVVNNADNAGRIPLFVAVRSKADELVPLLVKHGADLKARNSKGETVLHLAAMEGLFHVAEMLLEKGADLQARGFNGQTVLYYAVNSGRAEMFGMLLEKGADLRARDSERRTVLHCAVTQSQVQMTRMFLKKAALENVNVVNDADNKGNTPLFIAAGSGKVKELVRLLMGYGADVSVRNATGENVLHGLSCGPVQYVDLARDLIKRGASLGDRDYKTQYQPIHKAIKKGHDRLVKLYLDSGADVNSLVNDDETPLHIASKFNESWSTIRIMETLLKRGADVNRRTILEGRTPLHLACLAAGTIFNYAQSVERIRLLLFAGSDVLAEDRGGNTPFSFLVNIPPLRRHKPSIKRMLKTLALKKVCQPTIELKDEEIIEQHSDWQNYYRDCAEQIKRMKCTSFINSCTLFELLTKCHCRIAALFHNPDFEIKFKKYNLSGFSKYAADIRRTFKRAQTNHHSMQEHEDVINEAFCNTVNTLPYMTVRKVAYYMLNCRCDFARSL